MILSRMSPASKTIISIAIVTIIAASRDLHYVTYAFFLALFIALIGGIGPYSIVKAFLTFSPFIIGLSWFNALISISVVNPIYTGLLVAVRVMTMITASLMFALTTDPDDFAMSLIHQVKLPYQVAYSVSIAYTMLHRLMRSYKEIIEALKARWLIKSEVEVIRLMNSVIVNIIANVSKSAESLAISMEARGFGHPHRTYWRKTKFTSFDLLITSIVITALALPLLLGLTKIF